MNNHKDPKKVMEDMVRNLIVSEPHTILTMLDMFKRYHRENKEAKPVLRELTNQISALNMVTDSQYSEGDIYRMFIKESHKLPVPEHEILVPELLYKKNFSILVAMRGTGKTEFVAEAAKGLTEGKPFYGGYFKPNKPCKVLVITSEVEPQEIVRKTNDKDFDGNYLLLDTNDVFYDLDHNQDDPKEAIKTILKLASENGVEVVLWDSFSIFVKKFIRNESDNVEADRLMDEFGIYGNKLGLSTLFTFHATNKTPDSDGFPTVRGASAYEDKASFVYAIAPVNQNGEMIGVKMGMTKKRYGVGRQADFFGMKDGHVIQSESVKEFYNSKDLNGEEAKEAKAQLEYDRIKEAFGDTIFKSVELQEKFNQSKDSIKRRIKLLSDMELVETLGIGKDTRYKLR